VVPLVARGRVLGAISWLRVGSGRHYEPADLRLAEDLAGRAAQALDNARLFQREQRARQQAEAARLEIARSAAEQQRATAALVESEERFRQRLAVERALQWRQAAAQLIGSISTQFLNLAPAELDAGIIESLGRLGTFLQLDRGALYR
jgi:GAF domain-containing protein